MNQWEKDRTLANCSFGAVLVAAGNSTRMGKLETPGGSQNKVFALLWGKPVLRYSLEVLEEMDCIREIVVVCREQEQAQAQALLQGLKTPGQVVLGGEERQDSVLAGIAALGEGCDYFLIHDGARPLVTREVAERVCQDALAYGAAAAAVPVKDTYKLEEGGFVTQTPPRDRLKAVQTPQAFHRKQYLGGVEQAAREGKTYTDDCQLMESIGIPVYLSLGDYENSKVTTPEDWIFAQGILEKRKGNRRMQPRIGHGYDVHRLVEGRALIVGGVTIPYALGLLGHSDADVLCHAISDALLGAAGLGDIGKLFPDSDPVYAGISSIFLLEKVKEAVERQGYAIGNVDATLVAQAPKIAPYIPEMTACIAKACGVAPGQISIKATTEEGLGFTGAGEGMAATAVCLLFSC